MQISVRQFKQEDIIALAGRLREADAQEVIAEGNRSVEASLKESCARSTICLCVEQDGTPTALFGVVPDSILGPSARVWFLGAPELAMIKKTFVKQSRRYIGLFLDRYPYIWNLVDARYTGAIRWLKSCGAVFPEYQVKGPHGDPFLPFWIMREVK